MMTWQIMIGAQFISMALSAAVVVAFMLKKEPLDAPTKESSATNGSAKSPLVHGTV
ncbi:MAG: hypothetical protein ACI4HI_14980 [Lachnospiraceae bacterium]